MGKSAPEISYPVIIDPADDYFFEGPGRQNMSFQHALGELIDNAVAAFLIAAFIASARARHSKAFLPRDAAGPAITTRDCRLAM